MGARSAVVSVTSPFLAFLRDEPWAILPRHLEALAELSARGEPSALDAALAARARTDGASSARRQAIAVIPIHGMVTHRPTLLGQLFGIGSSTQGIAADLRTALADDSVKAILLDIDSPGGSVSGVEELARELYAARGRKPILAIANTLAASAAYWIGSQADELVLTATIDRAEVSAPLFVGWTYSDSNDEDDTITDAASASQSCVQDGGWVDFTWAVPDGELTALTIAPALNAEEETQDIALWEVTFVGRTVPTFGAGS